jgi:hypothetical protein
LRGLWFLVAILAVEVLLVSIGPGYSMLTTLCTEPPCNPSQLTPSGLAALTALGWTRQGYALYNMILTFALALIYGAASVVIFRAQPNEPMALFVSLVLLIFGVFLTDYIEVAATVSPWLELVTNLMPAVGFISFALLFYLFPDGRFVPRWTRWAAVAWLSTPVVIGLLMNEPEGFGPWVATAIFAVLILTCLIAPIYRYRKVSNPVERQQIKWIMFGLLQLMVVVIVFTAYVLPLLAPSTEVAGTLADLLSTLVEFISLAVLPITMVLAMLHRRLWAVDRLLNRTLVYIPLTSILTVIYTTSIAFSQSFFTTVTGDSSPAVAIFTAIILTATFTPLKNVLQTWVDRYFKEPHDQFRELRELEKRVDLVVEVLDRTEIARRLVEQTVRATGAKGAALYLRDSEQMRLVYISPKWSVREGVERLPLEGAGQVLGQLVLGERRDGDPYTPEARAELQRTAARIAHGLHRVAAWQTDSDDSPDMTPDGVS